MINENSYPVQAWLRQRAFKEVMAMTDSDNGNIGILSNSAGFTPKLREDQ